MVYAAGATKKVQKGAKKAQGKVQSAGKGLAKGLKKNLPNPKKPAKALKKAGGGGGADAWYGPDRATYLGETSPNIKLFYPWQSRL